MRATFLIVSLVAAAGCKKAPPENPEFSDAVRATFLAFDDEEAELAYTIRVLEDIIYSSMDVEAENAQDRALTPERLTEEDVAHLEHPDADPAAALPVAVARLSQFPVDDNKRIQMLTDQTPVEPYSPEYYERTFLAGEDCWLERGCGRLETWNDLIKENFLMTVPYDFNKDFRWVDLGLPDPADVPEGEEAVNEGEPRWGYVGRSWQTESASGENDNATIVQSYTIEVWVPTDDDRTLRMLSVWSETQFDGVNFSDDQVAGTTRAGIDKNFEAADTWLTDNPE